jgi:hypothetical protein
MFFARKRSKCELEPGTVHVREIGNRAVERAEIIDICVDGMGIPHVRYRATQVQSGRNAGSVLKVLAVSCFLDHFYQVESAA